MAGRGPAPKDPEKRERRNADEIAWTKIDSSARAVKPPALPGAKAYSAATRRWYRTWALSPQATTFSGTDWQRLHMLAPLVEEYFATPKKELMAEIRLSEGELGATVLARLRTRLKIEGVDAVGVSAGDGRQPSRKRADPRRLQSVK